jgi:hypothetical protein
MGAGGILILAVECYGWLYLGLWLSVTPAGVLKRFAIVVPSISMVPMQSIGHALLHLPLSVVFIWCGFNIAAMAWIARKRLERRISSSELSDAWLSLMVKAKGEQYGRRRSQRTRQVASRIGGQPT